MRNGTRVVAVRDINEHEVYRGHERVIIVHEGDEGTLYNTDGSLVDVKFDNGHQIWIKEDCVREA